MKAKKLISEIENLQIEVNKLSNNVKTFKACKDILGFKVDAEYDLVQIKKQVKKVLKKLHYDVPNSNKRES